MGLLHGSRIVFAKVARLFHFVQLNKGKEKICLSNFLLFHLVKAIFSFVLDEMKMGEQFLFCLQDKMSWLTNEPYIHGP